MIDKEIDDSRYITRVKEEEKFTNFLLSARSKNEVPFITLCGLEGSGAVTLVKNLLKSYENVIEIDFAKFYTWPVIFLQIAYQLEQNGQKDLIKSFPSEFIEKDNPSQIYFFDMKLLFKELSKKPYYLHFQNAHLIDSEKRIGPGSPKAIKSFIMDLKHGIQEIPDSVFGGIIVVSKHDSDSEICSNDVIYVKGFTLDQTREFFNREVDYELSDDLIKSIFKQTDGFPGILGLISNALKQGAITIEELEHQIHHLTDRNEVRNYIIREIINEIDSDNETRKLFQYLSFFEFPINRKDILDFFNFKIDQSHTVKEILLEAGTEIHDVSRGINKLSHVLLFIQDEQINCYKTYSYISNFLLGEFSIDQQKDQYRLISNFYDSQGDVLSASRYLIKSKEYKDAARILLNEDNYRKIINSFDCIIYSAQLFSLDVSKISNIEEKLNIIEKQGDISEIISDYKEAKNRYELAFNKCPEEDNIRKLRLLRKLGWVFHRCSKWKDAEEKYTKGLDLIKDFNSGEIEKFDIRIEKARLQSQYAFLKENLLFLNESDSICNEAIKSFEELVNFHGRNETEKRKIEENLAQAYYFSGVINRSKGKFQISSELLRKALALYEKLEMRYGICQTQILLTEVDYFVNLIFDASLEKIDLAITLAGELNSRKYIADAHRAKGKLFNLQGFTDKAIMYLEDAKNIYSDIHDEFSRAWSYNTIGLANLKAGNLKSASESFQNALNILNENYFLNDCVGIKSNIAILDKIKGKLSNFDRQLNEVLELSKTQHDFDWEFLTLIELIVFYLIKGEPSRNLIKKLISRCDTLNEEIKSTYHLNLLNYTKAMVLLDSAEYKDAINFLLQNNLNPTLFSDCSFRNETLLIELQILSGNLDQAKEHFSNINKKDFVPKGNNLDFAELNILQAFILLADNNSKWEEIFNNTQMYLRDNGSNLLIAESNFRVARILDRNGFPNKNKYLISAIEFYKSNECENRIKQCKDLLIEKN